MEKKTLIGAEHVVSSSKSTEDINLHKVDDFPHMKKVLGILGNLNSASNQRFEQKCQEEMSTGRNAEPKMTTQWNSTWKSVT